MKRKMICLLMLCLLLVTMVMPASAEDYTGKDDWSVTFDGKDVVSTFDSKAIDEAIYGLQPGDSMTIAIALHNTSGKKVDWYMTNEVLASLEDSQSVANGGSYTYYLTYMNSQNKETVLYSSDAVGGENQSGIVEGLHQATDSLKEYFLLEEMTNNGEGKITLKVALDGETQGNAYQDTLAKLQMNFAVEVRDQTQNPPPVYTGDNRSLLPYAIIGGCCGVVLLVLAFLSLRSRRKDEKVTKS